MKESAMETTRGLTLALAALSAGCPFLLAADPASVVEARPFPLDRVAEARRSCDQERKKKEAALGTAHEGVMLSRPSTDSGLALRTEPGSHERSRLGMIRERRQLTSTPRPRR